MTDNWHWYLWLAILDSYLSRVLTLSKLSSSAYEIVATGKHFCIVCVVWYLSWMINWVTLIVVMLNVPGVPNVIDVKSFVRCFKLITKLKRLFIMLLVMLIVIRFRAICIYYSQKLEIQWLLSSYHLYSLFLEFLLSVGDCDYLGDWITLDMSKLWICWFDDDYPK